MLIQKLNNFIIKTIILFILFLLSACSSFKKNDNIIYHETTKFLLFDNVKTECLKEYKLLKNGDLKELTDSYIYNTLILKNCQKTIEKTTE